MQFDNDSLSPLQQLQAAAMLTDSLSNLIDRSKHLCRSVSDAAHENRYNQKPTYEDHEALLRNTVELTAATIAETIQSLITPLKYEVEGPGHVEPGTILSTLGAMSGGVRESDRPAE